LELRNGIDKTKNNPNFNVKNVELQGNGGDYAEVDMGDIFLTQEMIAAKEFMQSISDFFNA